MLFLSKFHETQRATVQCDETWCFEIGVRQF
jgi:hypothetical protein